MSLTITCGSQSFAPNRVFCIGRNYVAHIEELQNEFPEQPVVFMKPPTSLVPAGENVRLPGHGTALHHEAEIVVLVGRDGKAETGEEAGSFIAGIGVGLDLTLRDVQSRLKKKGLPWELAKAFDGSAPISAFVPFDDAIDLTDISMTCRVNGEMRQDGNSGRMIYPIKTIIVALSQAWRLQKGDLIYTGTPEGVAPLYAGDEITVASPLVGSFSWRVE